MTRQSHEPVRVFLDATVMYAAAKGGGCRKLWDEPRICLVTNEYAASETWAVLQYETNVDECRETLSKLLEKVEIVPSSDDETPPLFFAWSLPDPEDVPILVGAIESNCQYLLTADSKCFGAFFGLALDGVTVLKPGKFMRLLEESANFPPSGHST